MDRDLTESNKIEFLAELAPLGKALRKSEYPDILLYEDNDTFLGRCDGQVYDFEIDEMREALLSTGVIEEDDLMPIVIDAQVKDSTNVSFPQRLEIRCLVGDSWEISLRACYSKDFENPFFPILFIKYCGEKTQTAQLTSAWAKLFEIEKDIFMRRLFLGGRARPRVRYTLG